MNPFLGDGSPRDPTPGRWLERIYRDSLEAIHGERLVRDWCERLPSLLKPNQHLHIVAAGKAACAMAAGVAAVEPLHKGVRVIITKDGHASPLIGWESMECAHPIPDSRSIKAARKLLALVKPMSEDDRLLFLLSGGASSLLIAPAGTLGLEHKAALTRDLLHIGADIHQINCVRKHLSLIKGGGLLRALSPASGWTVALSDVSGDLPHSIGSGMTVSDPTSYSEALAILTNFDLHRQHPEIYAHLRAGEQGVFPETLDSSDGLERDMPFEILASNPLFVQQMERRAALDGILVRRMSPSMDRDLEEIARDISLVIDDSLREAPTQPQLFLWGGEPTLRVQGKGRGGRMQHLGVRLAETLEHHNAAWMLAASSDGTDGPTDIAGVIVGPQSRTLAASRGKQTQRALVDFDSTSFHLAANSTIVTGPTGSNVGDVVALLLFPLP